MLSIPEIDKNRKKPREVFYKKALLENIAIFTGKQSFFNEVAVLKLANLLKETPTQVLSFDYGEIFKNILSRGHFR